MCELLVGLPEVTVLGVDVVSGGVRVHIETRGGRPCCGRCGGVVTLKERPTVALVDLPVFGRPARLVWHKRRWRCPSSASPLGSFTAEDARIAAPRLALTDRAGRWVTVQVGGNGRSVNEVAVELGCDWHTINDAVIA